METSKNLGIRTLRSSLKSALDGTVREFLSLFSNVLFAVRLLAAWAFLTFIGVIVDQGKDPSFYLSTYPPPLARLVLRLDLVNIYHSYGYVALIGLIVTSLTVATFVRVIPKRMPPLRPVMIEKIPLHATISLVGEEQSIRERIEGFFRTRGWMIRKREFGGTEWTFADKHNWARRGVLVAHVGFVLIAAGTTIYWALGFSGETTVLSGSSVRIPRTDALIHLERFFYKIQPVATKSGIVYQPIDYVSDLIVTDREGNTRKERLLVNHPIDIDGTLYYQASYGFAVNLVVSKDGRPVAGIARESLHEGDAIPLDANGESLEYARFAPSIDRRTGAISPDPRVNDPGVVLAVFDADRPVGQALVPFGGSLDLGNGYRVSPQRWTLFSGIQYRHDPGIPLVGLGAFVLLAGLCISFYLLPARLYVRIEGSGRAWSVGIAATTVKGYDLFEDQFRAIVAEFEQSEQHALKAHA
ncbi:MAG TPA: cytochrome c biogenesis protein ResB [Candidatus Baltobacteraceae bacterium]|jgi:cytochrome c biogenesis protein|nr:cytochrome c biogenesis protein ResB [Candidatus Baltobacteraceae bacterium]